jgi:hypothetical protein
MRNKLDILLPVNIKCLKKKHQKELVNFQVIASLYDVFLPVNPKWEKNDTEQLNSKWGK